MSVRGLLLSLSALTLAVGAGVWLLLREEAPARPEVQLRAAQAPADGEPHIEALLAAGPGEAAESVAEPQRDSAPSAAGSVSMDELFADEARAAEAAERAPASAHGRVVDSEGQPVAGARVLGSLANAHGGALLDAPANLGRVREVATDAEGRFQLERLDAGLLRIAVRAQEFAPLDQCEQPLPPGESLDLGVLRLEPGVQLAGRVLDADLRPVSEARIYSLNAPMLGPVRRLGPLTASPLGVSDSAGRFELECLSAGAWTLLVDHPDFPPSLFEGENLPPDLRREGLELVLQREARISGEVAEYDGRAASDLEVIAVPLEGMALLQESRPQGVTPEWLGGVRRGAIDAIGRFSLRGLAPGVRFALRVQRKQATADPSTLDREDPWAPWVHAQAGETSVRLSYLQGSRLEFQVLALAGGAPIENLRVRLEGVLPAEPLDAQGRVRKHFPEGRVSLSDLRALTSATHAEYVGDCEVLLRIEAPGFDARQFDKLRLESGGRLELGSVTLHALPILEVQVVAAGSGAPIPGARVDLAADRPQDLLGRSRSSSTTSGDGFARLTSIPGVAATLAVECAGWESRRLPLPVEARPGGPAFVVELSRGAQLLVRVHDDRDAPAPGSLLRLRREPMADGMDWARMQVADAQGKAAFHDLPRGVFQLVAQRIDGLGQLCAGSSAQAGMTQVVVQGGEQLEISVEVAALSSLSGDLWLGRDPLSGATICVEQGRQGFNDLGSDLQRFSQSPSVRSDERGAFGPIELAPGEYSLLIVHAGFGLTTRRVVRVEQRATHAILDLDDTAITGRVLDSHGSPVAGASVRLYPDLRTWREDLQPQAGEFLVPDLDPRAPVGETTTDADGHYRLRAVSPGTGLQLVFAMGRRASALPRVNATAGRTLENIDGRLPEAGSLRIVLSAPQPERGQHYGVRIVGLRQPPGLGLEAAHFDEQSVAMFDELSPGPWRVMVFALDESDVIVDARQAQTVQVQAAKETEFSVGW